MNVDDADLTAAGIAGAIGEPARARMLYSLADGLARTSTELAAVANVTPSTASVHLQRLKAAQLVKVHAQGKHRYYSLNGADVAAALEALSVLAGGSAPRLISRTPFRLREARTCYDHIAGTLGVELHDRFIALGWLSTPAQGSTAYDVTRKGLVAFQGLGIDLEAAGALRRRFAFACLDWSERRLHLGGALGAALLELMVKRRWIARDLDSRALRVTASGRRAMQIRFGLPPAHD